MLALLNAAIARPLAPRPAVAVEYRSTDAHQSGIASAASEAILLDWAIAWEARWARRHDGHCSAPVRGADGRFYCRFRRAWRR